MIAANNITATKVVTNAIQTRHIADDQVTEAKLANAINTSIAAKLPLAGGTMTGNIVMGDDTSIGIADDAERIEFDGAGDISLLGAKVGIGTDTPASGLHLSGADNTAVKMTFTNTANSNTYSIHAQNNSHTLNFQEDGVTVMSLATGGNLGIGGDPGAKLDVNSGTTNTIAHFHSTDDNGFIELKDDNTTGYIGVQDDYVYIGGAPSRSAQNLVINDGDGKVGIGDTSPFAKLHVEDTGWSSGAPYGTVAYIQGGATNDANWGHLLLSQSGTTTDTGGRLAFGANGENPIAGIRAKYKGATYGDLAFSTRPSGGTNTERMVIDSSGKVGIGETSPAATLHVEHSSSTAYNGAAEITESLIVSNKNGTDDSGVNNVASIGLHVADGATSQGFINYVRTGNNTGNFTFTQRTASSTYAEAMRIDSNGKVGIGQTDPATTLHIGDGASHYVRIENAGSGDVSSGYQIYRGCSVGMSLYDNPADNTTSLLCAGSLNVNCGGSGADLHVNTNGNVGIGDTTPSYKLDVVATGAAVAAFRGESGPYGMIIGGNDAGWGYIGSIGHANYDLIFNNDGYAHFGHGENTSFIYLGSQGGAYGGNSSHNLRASGGTFMYNSGSSNHVWEIVGSQKGYLNASGFNNGSDVSLKENIKDITYGLDTVKLLKPRKFDWKDAPADDKAEIGFIAQEVESIIPEIISESRSDDEGTSIKGMNYGALTSVLVKAIQELEARVKELEG